jgi:fructose-1,6-bisphosphatase/inositol monophosphatase family enzyme
MMNDKVETLMREAAARAILPRFRHLQRHEIEEKTPGELVTAADREAEQILTPGLMALLPGSLVIGEEAASADPALLPRLAEDEDVWLVDPVDGTANFAAGIEPFAVMVALVRRGETVASWMLDPVAGVMHRAERGAGAFVAGRRVTASSLCPLAAGLRGAVLKRFLRPEDRASVERRAASVGEILPGFMCAGREYPAIVAGEQHFALFWRSLPWDHAPGALFAAEAGAVTRKLDGAPYLPRDKRPGILVAQNDEVWRLVRATILADMV